MLKLLTHSNEIVKTLLNIPEDYVVIVVTPIGYPAKGEIPSLGGSRHNEIEWNMITGLRHRLVHDYEGTNWKITAKAVLEEIPVLINQLKELMLFRIVSYIYCSWLHIGYKNL